MLKNILIELSVCVKETLLLEFEFLICAKQQIGLSHRSALRRVSTRGVLLNGSGGDSIFVKYER